MTSQTQSELETVDPKQLVEQILNLSGHQSTPQSGRLRASLEELASTLTEADLRRFVARLASTGQDWGFNPPEPLARAMSRRLNGILLEGSRVLGLENLATARRGPAIFVANHLAFVDANAFDVTISEVGAADIADRLTALVGPKVYSLLIRRIASLCFGTIKIPQSQARASEEAVMSPRDVARISRSTIETAHERLAQGDHLLIFVEGTRSRSATLQRALVGVARYLDVPGAALIPVGLTGTERMVPIGIDTLTPSQISVSVGPPVETGALLDRCGHRRKDVMDTVGFLIADQLPPEYRGVYAGDDPDLAPAREAASSLA